VLLCVPDDAIALASRAVTPGPLVGHCSGASNLEILGGHEAFSLHPLMTVTPDGADFRGVAAAVAGTTPAALALGLVGALRSLAAVYSVTSTLQADGDLPADDPVALGLYLAAGELVTNAVKHSTATRVDIGLTVEPDEVRLSVTDNGIGGVHAVPTAVADRVRTIHGHAQIDSPVGLRTTVQIRVDRASAAGVPA